ncbi:MAG: hypothetical protein ACRENZ_04460 [Thermodesulfobacteriota bacterium]
MEDKLKDKSLTEQILEDMLLKLSGKEEFPPEMIENLEKLIEKNQLTDKVELLAAIKVKTPTDQ